MQPERLDRAVESLSAFKSRFESRVVIDRIGDLLEDLFLVRNPKYKFIRDHADDLSAFVEEYARGASTDDVGEWFYFPWNQTLAHYLPEDEHLEIRTARNRNIILPEEQDVFYNFPAAFAGLSVGSHALTTTVLMGGTKKISIADPDVVSPSNLNRIRYDYLSVGRKKTDLALEYVYQLNPYAEIRAFDAGVTEETMDMFFEGMKVLVEETDNLEMKIRLRLEARDRGIPVVMATDNGDNIIFECERFDLDPKTPLFNGAIGDITLEEFKSFSPQELPRLATKIAGPNFVTERMMQSLPEVGKTLYSWPQLADAATLSGVVIAYAVRRLALGQPLRTEKCEVNLDAVLDPEYESAHDRREAMRSAFLKAIGL